MSHRILPLPGPSQAGAARAVSPVSPVSPVLASTVVGVVLGVVGVLGVASLSGQSEVPQGTAVTADEAVLGGPEYGSRQ